MHDLYNVHVLNGSGAMINFYPKKSESEVTKFLQFNANQDKIKIVNTRTNQEFTEEQFQMYWSRRVRALPFFS